MSRSRNDLRRVALLLAAALAPAPTTAAAQEDAGVVDLVLPVVDLRYGTVSLDDSVRTDESADEIRVTLATDVLFRFDRASLTARARGRIDDVTARLRDAAPAAVRVDGHTDSKGSDAYNLALSRRRAQAVAAALRARLGAETPRLVVAGHGESDPVASNTTPEGEDNPRGRARNRRVTIAFAR
jgi:OOP family OmpA-OmpF porin